MDAVDRVGNLSFREVNVTQPARQLILGVMPMKARAANLMTDGELTSIAAKLVGEFRTSEDCVAGSVAAALVTAAGHVYSGICIDTACSLGFCAEHAAVAEMLKSRESEISSIVAVDSVGKVLAPCGRCRELLWQVNPRNANTRVILGPGTAVTLAELLPRRFGDRTNETTA